MKSITQTIEDFIKTEHQPKEDGRYLSWDYCFKFFKNFDRKDWDYASLMLAFYLASWGMYRGSAFLFQYTFTVHREPLKEILFSPKYQVFRHNQVLSPKEIPLLVELVEDLKEYYFEKNKQIHSSIKTPKQVSDTLISKILLGVFGNIPAYDTKAKEGLRKLKISQTMSAKGYLQLLDFYTKNQAEFDGLAHKYGYPPMKLIDMYLWKVGDN